MQILLAAATKSRSEKAKTQKRKTQNAKRKNAKTQKATAGGYPPATFLVCFINLYLYMRRIMRSTKRKEA